MPLSLSKALALAATLALASGPVRGADVGPSSRPAAARQRGTPDLDNVDERARAIVAIAAVLITTTALVDHLRRFEGHCGPYAPDIKRHPCSFARYLRNFFRPFAVAGLSLASLAVAAKCAQQSGWLDVIRCAWQRRRFGAHRDRAAPAR